MCVWVHFFVFPLKSKVDMYPLNTECGIIGGLITYTSQLLDIEVKEDYRENIKPKVVVQHANLEDTLWCDLEDTLWCDLEDTLWCDLEDTLW